MINTPMKRGSLNNQDFDSLFGTRCVGVTFEVQLGVGSFFLGNIESGY